MSKVVGIVPVEGEFNGFKYKNYDIHVIGSRNAVAGHDIYTIKVSQETFDKFVATCGFSVTEVIGKDLTFGYSRPNSKKADIFSL